MSVDNLTAMRIQLSQAAHDALETSNFGFVMTERGQIEIKVIPAPSSFHLTNYSTCIVVYCFSQMLKYVFLV